MDDDRGPLMFGVVNPDGTCSTPKEVTVSNLTVHPSADEVEVTACHRPYRQSWNGEIRIENPEVLRNVLGDAPVGTTKSICFESHEKVWYHRHDRVWQYRRERKGNRANRKVRGRWETAKKRLVIPNIVVTGIDQEFSADTEFPKTTVEFEARACSEERCAANACV